MKTPASSTATVASSTARRVMGLNMEAPKSRPAEATMRPPAESPMKNMKKRMYWPHITVLRMPVTTSPLAYCQAKAGDADSHDREEDDEPGDQPGRGAMSRRGDPAGARGGRPATADRPRAHSPAFRRGGR